jgi:hypothetical protein
MLFQSIWQLDKLETDSPKTNLFTPNAPDTVEDQYGMIS